MEVQRAEGMEVQFEPISLTWSLHHLHLKPLLLGFSSNRGGCFVVASLGLLHRCFCFCCFSRLLHSLENSSCYNELEYERFKMLVS